MKQIAWGKWIMFALTAAVLIYPIILFWPDRWR